MVREQIRDGAPGSPGPVPPYKICFLCKSRYNRSDLGPIKYLSQAALNRKSKPPRGHLGFLPVRGRLVGNLPFFFL